MARKRILKVIGLTMSILMCLCCISCTRPQKEEGTSEQRLTVEQIEIVYTPEFSVQTAENGAALFGRLLFLCGGPVLNDVQTQSVLEQIQNRILPRLQGLSVTASELMALLEKTDALCSFWEENRTTAPSEIFLQFYQAGLSIIPSSKLGSIIFTFTELYLNHKSQQCYERYETYGYQWYLDDAHRYADLLTQLRTTLGEEIFSQMVTIAVFALSLGGGAIQEGSHLLALSDEELAVLLSRQADYFCSANISQEQWGSALQIYTALFTPQGDTLLDAELSALFRSGYGGQAARCMPALLSLYQAVARSITAEQIATLRGETQNDALLSAIQLLCSAPAELLALERELKQYGFSQSKEEESALRSAGLWNDYQQFLEDTPTVEARQLLDHVNTYTAAPSEESRTALLQCAKHYLRTYLPCLAFVLSHSQS